jgi:hypothetical protein
MRLAMSLVAPMAPGPNPISVYCLLKTQGATLTAAPRIDPMGEGNLVSMVGRVDGLGLVGSHADLSLD